MKDVYYYLQKAVEYGASDLHLVAHTAPIARISGHLEAIDDNILTPETVKDLIYSLLSEEQKTIFEKQKELDFPVDVPKLSRFRANVHYQKGTVAAALRTIPKAIPTPEMLGLPEVVHELSREPRGLILVTGPTGSGKTTTQASIIDLINGSRSTHIITLEDPIEYFHNNRLSIIEQREIGFDSLSFNEALRRVLRQDPDVILVGEMRDLETVSTAITAAETGHLVISTLHTNDSVQTIDRIIDIFPPYQQNQIRTQLAATLVAVVAQQLIPRADGRGVVLASEVLRANVAVKNIIRKGNIHELYSLLEMSSKYGMHSMDNSLKKLYKAGIIKYEDALARAINHESLEMALKGAC